MRWRTYYMDVGLLVLVTAAAAGLRWAAIGKSLWLDELTTSWVIRDSWADILPRSLLNNLSPLFYSLTWATTRLAGYGEVGIRLPSLLAGILVVPGLYGVARQLTGSRLAAFTAALLAALDTSFINFALEARPYALVQLFALANIALVLGYLRHPTRRYAILLGLNAALLLYLHYTTALFIAVDVLVLLAACMRGQVPSQQAAKDGALAAAVCLAASLPLIPQLLYLTQNRHVLGDFIKGRELESSLDRFHAVRYVILPLAFGVAVGALVGARKQRQDEKKPAADPTFLDAAVLWFLLPPAAAWMLGKAGLVKINLDRYLAASSIACVLLAILAIHTVFSRRIGTATFVVLLLAALWWAREAHNDAKPDRVRPWRELIAAVNEAEPRNLAVYVNSGLIERRMLAERDDAFFKDYLLSPVNSAYRLRPDLLERTQPVQDAEFIRSMAATDDFLFIGSRKELIALQEAVAAQAERGRKSYELRWIFGGESTPWDLMAVHVAFQDNSLREE